MDCQLIGRWRIVAADLWERDYLDLGGPAMLDIGEDGHGEIAFGAMQASLDLAYGHSDVAFTWAGFDAKWTRSAAPGRPSSSMTAPWRSSSTAITATTPFCVLSTPLLQQPASLTESQSARLGDSLVARG